MNKPSFGKFHIKEIPDDMENLEETKLFQVMVKFFIRNEKRKKAKKGEEFNYNPEDIVWSTVVSRKFEEYLLDALAMGDLKITPSEYPKFKNLRKDFKNRHNYTIRSSTKYYDSIYKHLFLPLGLSKSDVKVAMLQFNTAYHMMKDVFHNEKRETKDEETWEVIRYFEHLKETMEIILYELPNPNMDKLIVALLHDVREDIPDIRYQTLEVLFGTNIANGVEELSKKDWKEYFTNEERKCFEGLNSDTTSYKEIKNIAKMRRSKDYFGHLEELDEDDLDVKFADRIHNLRTLDHCDLDKIVKKILETEDYFMDLAYVKKQDMIKQWVALWKWRRYAYDILKEEIDRLKSDFHINTFYQKKIAERKNERNMC